MSKRCHSIADLLMVIAAMLVAGRTAAAGDRSATLRYQGVERHYVLHNAPSQARHARKLIVVLAGSGQTLTELRRWLPIDDAADQAGFAVLYPEAIGGEWSYRHGSGIVVPGSPAVEVDDVGFIESLVQNLVAQGTADRSQVYVAGISRGALMTWTLLCQEPELFAAAAALSGAMTDVQAASCHPGHLVPIVAVDGTADPVLPYDGWLNKTPLPRLLSVPETLEFWRSLHGCTGETMTRMPHLHPDDPTRTQMLSWTGCARGGGLVLFRVAGGGHEPPSLMPDVDAEQHGVGRRGKDIETAMIVLNMFRTTLPKQGR